MMNRLEPLLLRDTKPRSTSGKMPVYKVLLRNTPWDVADPHGAVRVTSEELRQEEGDHPLKRVGTHGHHLVGVQRSTHGFLDEFKGRQNLNGRKAATKEKQKECDGSEFEKAFLCRMSLRTPSR